jgi:Fe-Mn family superoxide dismutase
MSYELKPLSCDPGAIAGMSEKIIVSHYENNYGGAVKRLNAIEAQLAALDWPTAPVFAINGLKREQMVAMNSMLLHECFSTAWARARHPRRAGGAPRRRLRRPR